MGLGSEARASPPPSQRPPSQGQARCCAVGAGLPLRAQSTGGRAGHRHPGASPSPPVAGNARPGTRFSAPARAPGRPQRRTPNPPAGSRHRPTVAGPGAVKAQRTSRLVKAAAQLGAGCRVPRTCGLGCPLGCPGARPRPLEGLLGSGRRQLGGAQGRGAPTPGPQQRPRDCPLVRHEAWNPAALSAGGAGIHRPKGAARSASGPSLHGLALSPQHRLRGRVRSQRRAV